MLDEARRRNKDLQLRLADQITAFAGSMNFIWIHVAFFAIWMLFLEPSPWPTLTLAVSLEAIFLSTFVLIGQNRQAAFQQAKADHAFHTQELELGTNTELMRQIHVITKELHRHVLGQSASDDDSPQAGDTPGMRSEDVEDIVAKYSTEVVVAAEPLCAATATAGRCGPARATASFAPTRATAAPGCDRPPVQVARSSSGGD